MSDTKRQRLTPHQREVHDRLRRLGQSFLGGYVPLEEIGSKGACEHLVAKGYAERLVLSGPRGGERLFWRTVAPRRGDLVDVFHNGQLVRSGRVLAISFSERKILVGDGAHGTWFIETKDIEVKPQRV